MRLAMSIVCSVALEATEETSGEARRYIWGMPFRARERELALLRKADEPIDWLRMLPKRIPSLQ